MRGQLLLCLFPLVSPCDGAYAQASAQPPSATATNCQGLSSPDKILACGDTFLKQCKEDWDAETHMSRQEYARACERAHQEMVDALIEAAKTDNRSWEK
jgi:hypothetical protein